MIRKGQKAKEETHTERGKNKKIERMLRKRGKMSIFVTEEHIHARQERPWQGNVQKVSKK